jgi:hypothetical protein
MKPLEKVYWLRLVLGAVAGLMSTGYIVAAGRITSSQELNVFMNGMSIALATFLISYYILKSKFAKQVEKPTKLLTTGIGIYFLAWITTWAMLYTLLVQGII